MVFERAYAQAPLTKASVSSMMVGRYFTELRRSRHRFTRIHEENDMLAERLGRAGYATSAVTSHAYLSRRSGYAQGFDSFNCVARRGAPWVDDVAVDHAIDEVERLSRGRAPFFFWLHLIDPHHPYEPHKSITAAGPSPALSLGSSRRERYLAEVAWTDGQLGRFIGALDEAKILDNVVLGIHSDHGESFGEHGLKYHGQAPYEEQIRAVLILRAPEVKPGRRASPVMLMDLHPTLVGLAEGAPLSATSAPPLGRPMSLWPTLFSAKPSTDRPIFAERHAEEGRVHRIVMVSGRHKLMHSPKYDTWSLFDLERDPGEINDRFSVDEARARRMKGVMRRFLSEMSLREAD